MIKPKEKPIIFSGPSIPAIQNLKPGTWPPEPIDPGKPWKWQTRRIVKDDIVNGFDIDIDGKVIAYIDQATGDSYKPEEICPYPPGTRLWVRETWQKNYWNEAMIPNKYAYKASPETWIYFSEEEKRLKKKWRSPRFMPKAAARLWLEVKSARVERLQNINHEDAIAEGTLQWICEEHKSGSYFDNAMRGAACAKPERAFALLWDSINAKRGYPWENNPWVWVYEFMRIE
jgi:hypothetical protein